MCMGGGGGETWVWNTDFRNAILKIFSKINTNIEESPKSFKNHDPSRERF